MKTKPLKLNKDIPSSPRLCVSARVIVFILFILFIHVKMVSAQTGEVQVQSDMKVSGKLRVQAQGDIAVGAYTLPSSSYSGGSPGENDGVGSTKPPSTSILYAWYKGDEVYTDAGATTKATTSGASIQVWKDSSTNGRDLVATSAGTRPTFQTAQIGTLPAVRFDGVNDFLKRVEATAFPVKYTIHIVLKRRASGGVRGVWCDQGSNTSITFLGTDNKIAVNTGSNQLNLPFDAATTFQVVTVAVDPTATSTLATGTQSVVSGTLVGATRGSGYDFGSAFYSTYADFDLAEAIIYSEAQTVGSGNGYLARKYLDAKYGLSSAGGATLPTVGLLSQYSAQAAYKDVEGTQLCSTSGTDTVAFLKDLTGSGKNLLQQTAAGRPKWFQNQVNSLPVLRFDGADDFLKTTFNLNQPTTIAMVVKQSGTSDGKFLFDGSAVNTGRVSQTANSFSLSMYAGANTALENPNAILGNYMIMFATFDGPNSKFVINNGAVVTGNCGSSGMGGLTLGSNANGTNNSSIDIVEVAVYNTALDPLTNDGLKVRQYLDQKYLLNVFSGDGGTTFPLPTLGLYAQYSAEKAFKDVGMTQPCTVSGTDTVRALQDMSLNNRHLTSGAFLDLKWIASQFNGRPVMRKDSSAQGIVKTGFNMQAPYTVYMVAKGISDGGYYWLDEIDARPCATLADPTSYFFGATGQSWGPRPAGYAIGQTQLLMWNIGNNGFYKIGTNPSSSYPVYNLSETSITDLGIRPNADWAEIIFYRAEHNADTGDGLAVRKYLNQKYNLGLTLP